MRTSLLTFVVGLSFATATFAEEHQFLLPIVATGISGGYETVWLTGQFVHNPGPESLTVRFPQSCPILCPDALLVLPSTTVFMSFEPTTTTPSLGRWVYADSGLFLGLRLTETHSDMSIALPVVDQARFTSTPLQFLVVPGNDSTRSHLRVYALGNVAGPIRVRVFEVFGETGVPDQLEAEIWLQLRASDSEFEPTSAELAGDLLQPASLTQSKLRIEVASPEGQLIWAFLSRTHNQRQTVDIIVPSP